MPGHPLLLDTAASVSAALLRKCYLSTTIPQPFIWHFHAHPGAVQALVDPTPPSLPWSQPVEAAVELYTSPGAQIMFPYVSFPSQKPLSCCV